LIWKQRIRSFSEEEKKELVLLYQAKGMNAVEAQNWQIKLLKSANCD
jgi:hypothetical protein